jgi:hypothetical protein
MGKGLKNLVIDWGHQELSLLTPLTDKYEIHPATWKMALNYF